MKTQRKKWISTVVVVVGIHLIAGVAYAGADPYGPKGKRFGAGLFLGEPTGITLKGYVSRQLAIDGFASWSFVDEAVTFIADATYDFFDIPVKSQHFTIPFYAGFGGKLALDRGGRNDGKTLFGLRVPVGVAMDFVKYPIEIFLEVAPGVELIPATDPDVTGGLGARFYFF